MTSLVSKASKHELVVLKNLAKQLGSTDALAEEIRKLDFSDNNAIYGYGYMRISDPDREDPESSFKTQEMMINDYARKTNIKIVQIYKEAGVSGYLPVEKRPAFQEIIYKLLPGQCIVAAASDRLCRNEDERKKIKDILKFKYCKMTAPDMKADNEYDPTVALLQTVQGGANQFFRDLAAKKTRDSLRRKAMDGTLAHRPYYGWRSGGKGKDWIPIEYEQNARKKIKEIRKTNPDITIGMIIEELTKNGFEYAKEYYNPNGSIKKQSKWCYGTVRSILTQLELEDGAPLPMTQLEPSTTPDQPAQNLPVVNPTGAPPPGPLRTRARNSQGVIPLSPGLTASLPRTPGPPSPPRMPDLSSPGTTEAVNWVEE